MSCPNGKKAQAFYQIRYKNNHRKQPIEFVYTQWPRHLILEILKALAKMDNNIQYQNGESDVAFPVTVYERIIILQI